jgi:hypothetical protein
MCFTSIGLHSCAVNGQTVQDYDWADTQPQNDQEENGRFEIVDEVQMAVAPVTKVEVKYR